MYGLKVFLNIVWRLTVQGFSNYSDSMETELKLLEEKTAQLIAHARLLRAENQELRVSLAQALDENRQLKENMALASARLQALIESLPQEIEYPEIMDREL